MSNFSSIATAFRTYVVRTPVRMWPAEVRNHAILRSCTTHSHPSRRARFAHLANLRGRAAKQSASAQLQETLAGLEAMVSSLRSERDYEQVHELAMRAPEHFDVIRKRYSSLTPRAPDVLSIRRVPPAPRRESVWPDYGFVFVAPNERPVWLKYGIRESQRFSSVSRLEGAEMLSNTFFDLSGPYE